MADVEKIKSMTREERSELFLNYDRLFTKIENLYRSSKSEAHKAYSKVLDVISDMATEGEHIKYKPAIYSGWDLIKTGKGAFDYCFRCKYCHKDTPDKAYPISPDFCPHCGARMDGE